MTKALNLIDLASIGDLELVLWSVFKKEIKILRFKCFSLLDLKSIYGKYWYERVFICLTFIIQATGILLSAIYLN